MKKAPKKLTLNRDTVRSLTTPALGYAAGAGTAGGCGFTPQTCFVSCGCTGTCNFNCFPTRVSNCTAAC